MLRWQLSTPAIGLCYALMQDKFRLLWIVALASTVDGLMFLCQTYLSLRESPKPVNVTDRVPDEIEY